MTSACVLLPLLGSAGPHAPCRPTRTLGSSSRIGVGASALPYYQALNLQPETLARPLPPTAISRWRRSRRKPDHGEAHGCKLRSTLLNAGHRGAW